MIWLQRFLCMSAAWLLTGGAGPAIAQTRVGEAAVVKNDVVRVMGPATSQISVGDGVLRDEIVRTGLDSAARLVMADSTNLSLGPSATIKLDRTVFNDEHTYRDIAIRLTTGAFASSPGTRTRQPPRSPRRSRPSACAARPSTSCRSDSGPPSCCRMACRAPALSAGNAST